MRVGGQDTAPEGRTAVDVANEQPQQDAEDHQRCDLLHVEDRSAGPVALIDQAELPASVDDGRGIVEDALTGFLDIRNTKSVKAKQALMIQSGMS